MNHTVYNYTLKTIKGEDLDLSQYRGKKILLVNTASYCGLTAQYAQLEELADNYADKLVVVGLPCNDFGGQEPDSEEKIADFCDTMFHVSFPLTSKVSILGDNPHPLYQYLTKKELNGYEDSEVKWNFQKYLINEEGQLVKVFSPMIEPLNEELIAEIAKN